MIHPTCQILFRYSLEKSHRTGKKTKRGKRKKKEKRRESELLNLGQNCVVSKLAAGSDSIIENIKNQTSLDVSIYRANTWRDCTVFCREPGDTWSSMGRASRHGSQDSISPPWLLQHKLHKAPFHSLQNKTLAKAWEVLTSQELPSCFSPCSCTHHSSQ